MKLYKSTISKVSLVKEPTNIKKAKIKTSHDAYSYIKDFYGSDIEIYESFYLLLMNRANITTGYVKISQAGTAGTVVDVKIVCKYAVESLAAAVILAHNHPSGNLEPSDADRRITAKIKEALNMFDIKVLDHLILSSEWYNSMADTIGI